MDLFTLHHGCVSCSLDFSYYNLILKSSSYSRVFWLFLYVFRNPKDIGPLERAIRHIPFLLDSAIQTVIGTNIHPPSVDVRSFIFFAFTLVFFIAVVFVFVLLFLLLFLLFWLDLLFSRKFF